MRAFDVAVVGAGVMGSATAYQLARSGRRVVLLERFELGHKRGSSHGSARIFRCSYPDPQYVSMAIEAKRLWREIEAESGRPLLTTTGGLDVGEQIDEHVAALKECGAECELLDTKEVGRRFPTVSLEGDAPVLFQPDTGMIHAAEAVTTFVEGAIKAGAEVRAGSPVIAIDLGEPMELWTDDESIEAGAIVVTAGSWVRSLVEPLGIEVPVRPTRETVAYFHTSNPQGLPLVEWGEPAIYSLPTLEGYVKAGEHIAGPTTDPDEEGAVNTDSIDRLSSWVGERFPDANPEPEYAENCLYTNTDDEHFILERHDRLIIGSPCSGHGFKFAPLIGKRLAALTAEVL